MTYFAEITEVATGITKTCTMDFAWEEWSEFLWSNGNFACDCNRQIFFDDDDTVEVDCTTERFVVVCKTEDGRVLYS